MEYKSFSNGGEMFMRADDHQVFQPITISAFGPVEAGQADEENTGWGWTSIGEIAAKDTIVPTTCDMKRP